MQKSKLMAVGLLACALSGFGLGMLDVQAALLPNNLNTVEIVPDLAVYSPEPEAATLHNQQNRSLSSFTLRLT